MTPEQINRYARHLILKEIGGAGQQALLGAKIAIIGAGGLGGPAGLYLAAAGIGHITLIDDDRVDLSNLQRQVQFTQADIDQPKVRAMAARLQACNPDCQITPIAQKLTADNAQNLLRGHDLILDGVDNFAARFAINAASRALAIALISGAVGRFEGQISLFNAPRPDSPCYRCLVPEIPTEAQSCAEIGIIGALTGIIGSVMALEAIKYLCKAGSSLDGQLWLYDGLTHQNRTIKISRDPKCAACSH